MSNLQKFLVLGIVTVAIVCVLEYARPVIAGNHTQREHLFTVQSVDTMKYSRDRAREALKNPSYQTLIDNEVRAVADTGATHIALATPYDEEFVPVLKMWVSSARKQGLSVWFRGNFSGWEGWFDYQKIDRTTHLKMTEAFITSHPDLFSDGDIFTPCPECENGGPGDPRQTRDTAGFKKFLIDERIVSLNDFSKINKKVQTTYTSMNGDVARLIMDPATTDALGNVVVVDHYVPTVAQFGKDILAMSTTSQGDVALGEFGAPIPDLQGDLSPTDQAGFVEGLLGELYKQSDHIVAVNYWSLNDSSTALLDGTNESTKRPVYDTLKTFYKASYVTGTVKNSIGDALPNMPITVQGKYPYSTVTDKDGYYQVFVPFTDTVVTIGGGDYPVIKATYLRLEVPKTYNIILVPLHPSFLYQIRESMLSMQAAVLQAFHLSK